MYRLRRSFTIVVAEEITHRELEDYAMKTLKQEQLQMILYGGER